jgi:hypothetical protein
MSFRAICILGSAGPIGSTPVREMINVTLSSWGRITFTTTNKNHQVLFPDEL